MKFFATILCFLVALTSAAVINGEYEANLARREVQEAVKDVSVELVTTGLDHGREKVEFVVDGTSEGYVIFAGDGDVRGFDADGKEIDLDAGLDGISSDVAKRGWVSILIRLGPIIKRYGQRAIAWFRCIGAYTQILNCGDKLLRCAQMGEAPWDCISGISCIGKAAKNC